MTAQYQKYKGIHPGIILDRELKKRSVEQHSFALSVGENPQTFNALTKGEIDISVSLALKIERELGLEEGTLVLLQAYYDIQKIKEKEKQVTPDLSVLGQSLFWDTDIKKINWQRQYRAVIERVFERGSEDAKKEIIRFYGTERIRQALAESSLRRPYTVHRFNPTSE